MVNKLAKVETKGTRVRKMWQSVSRLARRRPTAIPAEEILPVEIWEMIIDDLQNDPSALGVCKSVCKVWHARAQFHAPWGNNQVTFPGRGRVYRFSKAVPVDPSAQAVRDVTITGDGSSGGSVAHFGTFAFMLGRRLPGLSMLTLKDGIWRTGAVHVGAFRQLITFDNLTTLRLWNVKLQSSTIVARLVGTLPRLEKLSFSHVEIFGNPAKVDPNYPRGRRDLATQALDVEFDHTDSDDISRFILAVGLSGLRAVMWVDRRSAYHRDLLALSATGFKGIHSSLLQILEHPVQYNQEVLETDILKPPVLLLVSPLTDDSEASHIPSRVARNLSCVSGDTLITIVIGVDARLAHPSAQVLPQVLLARLVCDLDLTQLDDVLSTPPFVNLKEVWFELYVQPRWAAFWGDQDSPVGRAWQNIIKQHLVRLRKRGVLRFGMTTVAALEYTIG